MFPRCGEQLMMDADEVQLVVSVAAFTSLALI